MKISTFSGKVYLVGAGPGDPELITLKALNLLKKAEVILYDSLLNIEILNYAPKTCKKIFVGKRFNKHSLKQNELNELLYQNAIKYTFVIRLKGGDPFIFGRGGEEVMFLQNKNIAVEVIPGITTAVAASATLQVALTHRNLGQSVIFLSGYSKEGSEEDHLPAYDWLFLSNYSLTIVFYMALKNIKIIAQKLIEHGKSPDTGVAVISDCTMPNEKRLITTLGEINNQFISEEIRFPAIILIGDIINEQAPQLYSHRLVNKKENKNLSLAKAFNKKDKKCLLVLFHGAKKLEFSSLPDKFVDELKKKLNHELVRYAFLTNNPSFKSLIKELAEDRRVKQIEVFPLFLLPGRHLDKDIPEMVALYKKEYPNITIKLRSAPEIIRDFLPKIAELARLYLKSE